LTILVDANLLIYAYNSAAAQHGAAKGWLEARLAGSMRVGLPWVNLLAFLRVVTHPRLFPRPAETADAWKRVTDWLSSNVVWIPLPTEEHAELLGRLLALPGVRANLVHDADLAALAIEHGLILCSTDGDFARFPGLRWRNPIAG
jgi:toxin-antitoxin system PIN domain toxin